ncbi:FAD-dependent oxidoreductase, partial [Methanocalculus natronophilus]|uniref:FAD-dependent oxidoreductase n=1 Tax=Methanocalculus natronophilus TaxID=1262400 RepID=UPI0031B5926C
MKVIVIGGVAAGMSAASKLKRNNPDTSITVYEYGEDLSYGACGMPYYISDLIPKEKALIARTKSEFKERGIDVKTSHEVISVEPNKKSVTVKNLKTGESFSDDFDKLIIASGASAIRLPVKGKESKRIKVLSSLEDARDLKHVLTQNPVKNVAVIGGGFT